MIPYILLYFIPMVIYRRLLYNLIPLYLRPILHSYGYLSFCSASYNLPPPPLKSPYLSGLPLKVQRFCYVSPKIKISLHPHAYIRQSLTI